VVTELNEDEFPPRLLLADANFCSDGSGGEVPEKGNPAVLMKYILNYMARVAKSKAHFTYQTENAEAKAQQAELQAMIEANAKEAEAAKKKRRDSGKQTKNKPGESTL